MFSHHGCITAKWEREREPLLLLSDGRRASGIGSLTAGQRKEIKRRHD